MKKKSNLNWWKWSFLCLLAFNTAFLMVIASRLIQVREPESELIAKKTS
ncbi:PF09911 domain protein [Streptococcus pyogenes GA41208]|nr:PF09911 domain protein [Streptococcus pyogenes GA41208]